MLIQWHGLERCTASLNNNDLATDTDSEDHHKELVLFDSLEHVKMIIDSSAAIKRNNVSIKDTQVLYLKNLLDFVKDLTENKGCENHGL